MSETLIVNLSCALLGFIFKRTIQCWCFSDFMCLCKSVVAVVVVVEVVVVSSSSSRSSSSSSR